MTTIRKHHREAFTNNMAAKIYDDRIAELQTKLKSSGMGVYRAIVSEELEAQMRAMPKGFFLYTTQVKVCLEEGDYYRPETLLIQDGKEFPVPYKAGNYTSYGDPTIRITYAGTKLEDSDPYKKKLLKALTPILKIYGEIKVLNKEKSDFVDQLSVNLSNITTLKRLQAYWPDIYDDFIELSGVTEPKVGLPALPIGNLNDIIKGWKKKQAKVEALQAKAA